VKDKIINWFCREGSQGVPDCDNRCPSRGDNPCFNRRELEGMLDEYRAGIVAEMASTLADKLLEKDCNCSYCIQMRNRVEAWKQAKIKGEK
jgi:hypothetical protein